MWKNAISPQSTAPIAQSKPHRSAGRGRVSGWLAKRPLETGDSDRGAQAGRDDGCRYLGCTAGSTRVVAQQGLHEDHRSYGRVGGCNNSDDEMDYPHAAQYSRGRVE
jgi:hypothetical protein